MRWPFVTRRAMQKALQDAEARIEAAFDYQVRCLRNEVEAVNRRQAALSEFLGVEFKYEYPKEIPGTWKLKRKEQGNGIGQ